MVFEKLHKIALDFPDLPGVYLFESKGKPLYIGKAKSLKKRIMTYFHTHPSEPAKIKGIFEKATHLRYIQVQTEKEALLLEANLIYAHKPPLNTFLKDTRFYPYIHISKDQFPRLQITRYRDEEGRYYGPFTNVSMVRKILDIIYRSYGIRPCDYDLAKIAKPCLEYHLGRCMAPCGGSVTQEDYEEAIQKAEGFLQGDIQSLKRLLEEKMQFLSDHLIFEKAGSIRDMIQSLDVLFHPQYVVLPDSHHQDFVALSRRDGKAVIIRMKEGIIFSVLSFDTDTTMSCEEIFAQFYFGKHNDLPDTIITDLGSRETKRVQTLLDVNYVGGPRFEGEEKVFEMALQNLQKEVAQRKFTLDALKKLQITLGLKKLPRRIEGIDIAHTQGLYTVASVVSFHNGIPDKQAYRRYRITQLDHPDDFESMRIVGRRRYSKHELPDLILIDGGIGQVAAMKGVLEKELQIKKTEIVGLAKSEEIIVFSDERGERRLPHESPVLRLLIGVRDEAHRFANTFHSQLRDGRMKQSQLESIPGVGKVRKLRLLRHFGSIRALAKAPVEEIGRIVRDEALAHRIKSFLESRDD